MKFERTGSLLDDFLSSSLDATFLFTEMNTLAHAVTAYLVLNNEQTKRGVSKIDYG